MADMGLLVRPLTPSNRQLELDPQRRGQLAEGSWKRPHTRRAAVRNIKFTADCFEGSLKVHRGLLSTLLKARALYND
jgi:hypothetical protein